MKTNDLVFPIAMCSAIQAILNPLIQSGALLHLDESLAAPLRQFHDAFGQYMAHQISNELKRQAEKN